MMGCLSTMD